MLEKELKAALARGVRVEVIAPGKIGPNIVQRAARSRWRGLMEAGVEMYTYQRSYYHCKVLIIDDVWVCTGSVNLDRRSFRLNDEANINVYDRKFAERQIEIFERDKGHSRRLTAEEFRSRPWIVKFLEQLAGLLRFQL